MKRNMIIVAALATLLIPSLVLAESPRSGPYVAWFVGVTVPQDRHAETFNGGSWDDRVEFDPGIDVGGAGGYDFGFVRLEGELSYKYGDIASVYDTANDIRYGDMHGYLGVFAAMANCFIDLHNGSPVTPYIGGGIGVATLYLDDTSGVPRGGGSRTWLYDSDDDTVFAYQAGAGLEISLNRHISLDLGYRYFATSRARFEGGGQETRMRFESHNGTLGFRYNF